MPTTLVIRGSVVVDGTGAPPYRADVAVEGDRILGVGEVPATVDALELDGTGLVTTPGFVNVLSHGWASLQVDGRGLSDLVQGVTTELFGEAYSLGPTTPELVELLGLYDAPGDTRYDFARLSEGLAHLERLGVSPNVASLIGGTNLRAMGAGLDDRPLTAAELDRLQAVVREEMADGAFGIGTALIYPPGRFADTDELVAVCSAMSDAGGVYVSHLRSEGDTFVECFSELLEIGRRADVAVEVYHLKAAGRHNWHKMAEVIGLIEQARSQGVRVTANMYPYEAGATALHSSIPPSFHVGGPDRLAERLADPAQRRAMHAAISGTSAEFENLYRACGGGAGILLLRDLVDGTPTAGRTLLQVSQDLGIDDDVEGLLELVRRDPGLGVAYFVASEDNLRLGLSQPWVSLGSDAEALAAEEPWTSTPTHPRSYGTFARFLGRYARDEGLASLPEAVRRMTSLPCDTFAIKDRGRVEPGRYADLVVLDPATVLDTATYADPHRYAVGVRHVVVNGVPALRDGLPTDARPGRHLRRGR